MNKALMLQCDNDVSSLPDLLGLISLGRQYCTVEVYARQGALLGEIAVKAGMLLSARGTSIMGRPAFATLLHDPEATRYEVYRVIDPPRPLPEPIGPLEHLMLEAAVAHDEASQAPISAEPGTPQPAVPLPVHSAAQPEGGFTAPQGAPATSPAGVSPWRWWRALAARLAAWWRGQ